MVSRLALLSSKIKRSVKAIPRALHCSRRSSMDRKGELAHGPVKLATFDGQVLLALRARQFEPGSNLLPEMIH